MFTVNYRICLKFGSADLIRGLVVHCGSCSLLVNLKTGKVSAPGEFDRTDELNRPLLYPLGMVDPPG